MEEEIPPLINMNPVPKEDLVVGKRYYYIYRDGMDIAGGIGEFINLAPGWNVANIKDIAVEIDENCQYTPGKPHYRDPNEERETIVHLDYASFHEYVHAGH